MTTVGLYDQDSQIHYIDQKVAILVNPYDGKLMIVARQEMPLEVRIRAIKEALKTSNMRLKGTPYFRENDGLWCCEVRRKGDA